MAMIFLAADLEPMAKIAATGGPIKIRLLASHWRQKSAFSERKP